MKNTTKSNIFWRLWACLCRLVLPSRVRYYANDQEPYFLVDWIEDEHFDSQSRYRSSGGILHQFYVHDMFLVKGKNNEHRQP